MRNFMATVLSVIAAGVMLIAYGLLSPRVAATDVYAAPRPMLVSERAGDIEVLTPRQPFDQAQGRPIAYRVNDRGTVIYDDGRSATALVERPAPVSRVTRTAPARVARSSGRDWTKTAMVIGGTSAAGAGLGAIFGGKKGALIGAAIGGGAGTIYEVRKR
jgi:hypothetical protein